MKEFFNSTLSESVGITLLHSLWQGLLGVTIILIISRLIGEKNSSLKYWLFVGVFLLVFVANIFTLNSRLLQSNNFSLTTSPQGNSSIFESVISFNSQVLVKDIWSSYIITYLPYFVMLWWIGIIVLCVRFAFDLRQTIFLSKKNHFFGTTKVNIVFERLKHRMKIKKLVKLGYSKYVIVPSVIGHFKPIILLPIGLVNGLSTEQVEAILLHELSHIKRHDFLVNLIQSIIEVIYFFNPFIWIISRAIRDEREHACDDSAISHGISASTYAQTLAGVFNYAIKRQQFSLTFASKNKLTLKRIQRIMKTPSNNNNLVASTVFMLVITLLLYFGGQSHALSSKDNGPLVTKSTIAKSISNDLDFTIKSLDTPEITKNKLFKQVPSVSDTTDIDELKKHTDEYDKAMEGLKSTKEWQEVEKLGKAMTEEYLSSMKEFGPLMEDALRLVEESLELNSQDLIILEEKMALLSEHLVDFKMDEKMARAFELNQREIEETLQRVQTEIEEINLIEVQELAKIHTLEAEEHALEAMAVAKEAELVAVEAIKHARVAESFLDDLKPMLVNDGYIKSVDDLERLKIEDGNIWVNGDKVKAKDAEKYLRLNKKYFNGENFYLDSRN